MDPQVKKRGGDWSVAIPEAVLTDDGNERF